MEAGDRERARPLAARLAMPVLARAWQMLLKGIEEVQTAPSAKQAAEMLLVRLAYVADLPVPAELVKALANGEAPVAIAAKPTAATPAAISPGETTIEPVFVEPFASAPQPAMTVPRASGNTAPALSASELAPLPVALPTPPSGPLLDSMPQSFDETLALFEKHGEVITRAQLRSRVHLVAFEPGRIEFRPADGAPRDLANKLGQRLSEWTGTRWVVVVSQAEGAPTLEKQAEARDREMKSEVAQHPLVRAVLDAFPGATIASVRERFAATEPAAEDDSADDPDGPTPSEEDEP
jgi:DNA polymerase-3 subunit gamma/tau